MLAGGWGESNWERGLLSTVHDVRDVDQETAFLGVVVGEDAVVGKVPAESVGDVDNQTLGRALGSSDVGVQAMDLGGRAGGHALLEGAAEAVWTGHCREELRYDDSIENFESYVQLEMMERW